MPVCPECSGDLRRLVEAAGGQTVQVVYECTFCGARTLDSVVEQRRDERHPLSAKVGFAAGGAMCAGELRNISAGGFAFVAKADLSVGQQINFRLDLDAGEVLRGVARVVWRRDGLGGAPQQHAAAPREYGLMFVSALCPPRLTRWLEEHL